MAADRCLRIQNCALQSASKRSQHPTRFAVLGIALIVPGLHASDETTPLSEALSSAGQPRHSTAPDTSRYAIDKIHDGHVARNSAQRWITTFDGRGFTTTPTGGEWSWGLEIERYGWGGELHCVSEPKSSLVDQEHLAYLWDDTLQEWYVNDQHGLEHGYVILAKPISADGLLTLEIRVRGGLQAVCHPSGREVAFVRDGAQLIRYSNLVVFDANGWTLPANFTQSPSGSLFLSVNDCDATYPLTIDPIAQQAYVKASNTGPDRFGRAIAISGDTMVIGAPYESSHATGVNGDQLSDQAGLAGAAYVFVRNGGTWTQQAYLKASNTSLAHFAAFGTAVSISGDTIVVGAPGEDSSGVGVNGNQMGSGAPDSGAAYVFVRSNGTWAQQAYLKASNAESGDQFGHSVDIFNDTVVVGARGEDSNSTGVNGNQSDNSTEASGAAYVFVRIDGAWTQQAYLKASSTDPSDFFGESVSISSDSLVISAPGDDGSIANPTGSSIGGSGAAYVFTFSGGSWTQQAYLKTSNASGQDQLLDVDISGDTIVVGARLEDSKATGVNGSQGDNSATDSGAAYVFDRTNGVWLQTAYLKASNTATLDFFGWSVSIYGDVAVIGALGEDSNATGINGDQSNNSASRSGAAYVFQRTTGTWSQQAYLKASNTGAQDEFGDAVTNSGDTILIGASGEASSTTGVNGNQLDNSMNTAGAVYVFDSVQSCQTIASAVAYGIGKPGALGVPTLASNAPPALSTTSNLTLTGGLPGATPTILFAGVSPASLPFDGGSLLVNPGFVVNLPPLDSSGGFTLPVPIDNSLCGLHVYFQVTFYDPSAAGFYHTALSNGLHWTLGS